MSAFNKTTKRKPFLYEKFKWGHSAIWVKQGKNSLKALYLSILMSEFNKTTTKEAMLRSRQNSLKAHFNVGI